MEEGIHDIAVLLAGIGSDREAVFRYFETVKSKVPMNISLPRGVEITLLCAEYHAHRIMEIRLKDDTDFLLSHWFTGHRRLDENGEGIEALIYTVVHKWHILQSYDIIVMNSAAHDYNHGPGYMKSFYFKYIDNLLNTINVLTLQHDLQRRQRFANRDMKKEIKFVWRGNTVAAHHQAIYFSEEEMEGFETKVANLIESTSSYMVFVNLSSGLKHLPTMPSYLPGNNHIGQAAHIHRHPFPFLWTSLCTQMTLDGICG